MTVECLKSSMLRIERYFGKELSTDERTARAEVYAAALKEIPDDVVSAALVKALTVCRYQNQLLVDWCAEIRKIQDVGRPTANDLWNDAAVAARKIEANLYYMHIGGLITADGKLNRDDLKRRNTEIFAALPVAVQRWAGSPEDLSDIFPAGAQQICGSSSGRASTGLCRMPRLRVCSPRLCPAAQPRHRLEVARREIEKTIPQPDCVRFVCDGWLHPHKHGLLPAGERSGNRAGYLRQQVIQLGAHGRRT